MNLPHELAWVLQMLDFEWPEVDEDEVQRGASMLRQYGEDLSACIAAMDAIVADQIVPAYETSAGGAIGAAWNDQRSENLGQLVELIDPAAQGMDIVSDAVIALKLKVVAEPVITAAQIAAAIAAAAFTFGASLAAQTGILIARKAALKFATNVAIEQLIVQVIDLIDEPLLNLGMQLVDRILEAPVVADAVGEAESYLVDLARGLRRSPLTHRKDGEMTLPLDDWSADLAERTTPRFRGAFEALLADRSPEEIAGLGVYTDADAAAVVVAANTAANLEARVAQAPTYPRYFRWSPGEWDLLSFERTPGGADGLGPLNDEIERLAGAAEDGELDGATTRDVREAAWRAMLSSLVALRSDGFFERWPDAVVVLDAMDAAITNEQRRAWIRAINDADDATAHEEWLAQPSS